MTDVTSIFGGAFVPGPPTPTESIEAQLSEAIRSAGLHPPHDFFFDGHIHRFSTNGKAGDDAGWYVIYPEHPVAGAFGDWREAKSSSFRADTGQKYSDVDNMFAARKIARAREQRAVERKEKADTAALAVAEIWYSAIPAKPDHPYLARKGIQTHGAKISSNGRLIVPLLDAAGNISSIQYIGDDGEKRYHPGAATKACSWMIGEPGPTIFVAEGFATAATVHEVSGHPCVVAFSANNLPLVVGQLRERYGATQDIVIVADNDASGVGRNKADEASASHGARIVMPPTEGDANDYHQAGHDLAAILFPVSDGWLKAINDFKKQPAPIKWFLKRWLQSDALIMVHGPSGGGKTFLVLDMVLSIASKGKITDWHGYKVRPAPVVYLAGEGHHGLRGRIAAWSQHHHIDDHDAWISDSGLDLDSAAGYQKAADAIRALPYPPALIVIDTLHRFLSGDENKAQDAKLMLDACAGLMREFNASVILVHHTGVSDEAQHRARGSSAWRGALDIEISVVPGETIEIVQRKSKDAEIADPVWLELQTVPIDGWLDEDGEPYSSAVLVPGTAPVTEKADSSTAKARKLFERAWWHAGAEVVGMDPYLSREGFVSLLEQDRLSPGTIKNYIKASYANGPIYALLNGNIIQSVEDGWIVTDLIMASILLSAKQAQ